MIRRDSSRGQGLVEFAIVLPVLMLLLVGFFDLGRVILAHDALSHAAREAVRYAIVHGASSANPLSGPNACPVGPLPSVVVAPAPSASCPHPSPSKESIRIEARQQAAMARSDVTVEVCYGEGCVGDVDAPGATNERGTPVTVTLHETVGMAAASLLGFSSFTITSSSTMLVNH
jgi:Flp pilus assembly protein TadG